MSWNPPPPPPPPLPPPSAPRPSGPRTWVPGLVTGTAIVAVPALASVVAGATGWLVVVLLVLVALVPLALVVGTVLAILENTRSFGIGLLISTGIGAIVLAGVCFGVLATASGW